MEEHDYYPPKPELVENKPAGNPRRTFISILLFGFAFLMMGTGDFLFVSILVSVLLIHELGHFLLMKIFGHAKVRMLFIPLLGAFMQGKKELFYQKQSLFVVFGGPIPGIVLGMTLAYFGVQIDSDWMKEASVLFLSINMLNLLPLDPLDGGQILKLLIHKNQEKFQLFFTFISSLIMISIGWYFQLWIIVVFGFFMGFSVRAKQKKYHIHKELEDENVNFETTYKSLSNRDFSIIKRIMLTYTPALRTYMEQATEDVIDPIVADQVNNVLITPLDRNASFVFRFLSVLVWLLALILPIILLIHLQLIQF